MLQKVHLIVTLISPPLCQFDFSMLIAYTRQCFSTFYICQTRTHKIVWLVTNHVCQLSMLFIYFCHEKRNIYFVTTSVTLSKYCPFNVLCYKRLRFNRGIDRNFMCVGGMHLVKTLTILTVVLAKQSYFKQQF